MQRRRIGLLLVIAGLLFCLVPLGVIEYEGVRGRQQLDTLINDMADADPAEQARTRAEMAAFNDSFEPTGLGTQDPFDSDVEVTDERFAPEGEAFAHIVIPRIDVSLPVYLGATPEHLGRGAAQVEGTSLPIGGVGNRSVIAGHNGTYTNHFFLFIDQLEPGDRIYLVTQGELLTYEVYGEEVIDPSEWNKLAAVPGQDTLTLLTCTPLPANTHRLLVDAKRVDVAQPAPYQQDTAETVRHELAEAQASASVSTTQARWQAVSRVAIVVLSGGLVWTLVLLFRTQRRSTNGASVRAPAPR